MFITEHKGALVFEINNEYVLYNTYTDDFVKIEKNNNFDISLTAEMEEKFVKEGIIFEDNFEYNSVSRYMINKSKYVSNVLQITDALSYNCNLKCVYCMQQNIDKKETCLSFIKKVEEWKYLKELFNCCSLNVCLFGGEPFIDLKYVRDLVNYAKEIDLADINYTVVTNGTIVNDELINLMNESNFEKIQITVDGLELTHNKRRVSNEFNCFSLIIVNLKKLLEKTNIKIIINTVIDNNNFEEINDMVNFLISEFTEHIFNDEKRIVFNFGMECHPSGKSNYTISSIPNILDYTKRYYDFLIEIVRKGIFISQLFPTPLCINKVEKDILLAPNGDVFKCISGLGSNEYLISTYDELMTNPMSLFINLSKHIERYNSPCQCCKYQSLCNGGCYYNSILEDKKFICSKSILDATIEDILYLKMITDVQNDGSYRIKKDFAE